MSFNPETSDFEGIVRIRVQNYPLSLADFAESESEQAASLAGEIEIWLGTNLAHAKAFAASKLLALKNDCWLGEAETPVSPETFVAVIELKDIGAYSDRHLTLYFSDGDLFWGHCIQVDVDKDFVLRDANLAG